MSDTALRVQELELALFHEWWTNHNERCDTDLFHEDRINPVYGCWYPMPAELEGGRDKWVRVYHEEHDR